MKTPPGTPRARQRKPTAQRLATAQPRSGRDRLRNVVLGIVPAELGETPEYARYQGLLPQNLAPTVGAR
jgi:hypothetical protein